MKIFLVWTLYWLLGWGLTQAQQSPLSALQFIDPSRMILSAAGLQGENNLSVTYRDQWTGLPGRPVTAAAGCSGPLKSLGGAWSGLVSLDQLGLQRAISMRTGYNQVFPMEQILISAGLGLGWDHRNWDGNAVRTPEGIYGTQGFDHLDPGLVTGTFNHNALEIIPSVYIQTRWAETGIELGVPILQQSAPVRRIFSKHFSLKYALLREFKFNKVELLSQLFLYSDFIRTQSELFFKMSYNGNIFGGISLRGYDRKSLDALGMMAGIRLSNHLFLYLGVEMPLNALRSQLNGWNQDFGLSYRWGARDGRRGIPIIYNPRW